MEELVDKKRLAEILQVRVSTIDYLRRSGKIPYLSVGKHPRYQPAEVVRKLRDKKFYPPTEMIIQDKN